MSWIIETPIKDKRRRSIYRDQKAAVHVTKNGKGKVAALKKPTRTQK
jgi:hypothetical protein